MLAFLLVPLIVSPLNFLPRAWTPSTYLPGLTLITSFFLSVLPALLTAFWIVRYLQPCLQTTSALFLFLPPLPAIAEAGTASIAMARNAVAMRTIKTTVHGSPVWLWPAALPGRRGLQQKVGAEVALSLNSLSRL